MCGNMIQNFAKHMLLGEFHFQLGSFNQPPSSTSLFEPAIGVMTFLNGFRTLVLRGSMRQPG